MHLHKTKSDFNKNPILFVQRSSICNHPLLSLPLTGNAAAWQMFSEEKNDCKKNKTKAKLLTASGDRREGAVKQDWWCREWRGEWQMEEVRATEKREVKGRWEERKKKHNVAGVAEAEGKQCPSQAVRVLGAWYRGVAAITTPTPPARRGQLSYAGLTASVCCVLAVCLDSPALLSQQLNNRWLKKASIQSALDQKNHTKEGTQAADKTHRHTCKLHGLSQLHMLQKGEQ